MLERSQTSDNGRRDVPARDLVSAALSACGLTLEAQLGRSAGADELRETVGAFVRVARQQDVPPERTLAVFKRMASRLKPVDRLNVVERGEIVDGLVQMAIEKYYECETEHQFR